MSTTSRRRNRIALGGLVGLVAIGTAIYLLWAMTSRSEYVRPDPANPATVPLRLQG